MKAILIPNVFTIKQDSSQEGHENKEKKETNVSWSQYKLPKWYLRQTIHPTKIKTYKKCDEKLEIENYW